MLKIFSSPKEDNLSMTARIFKAHHISLHLNKKKAAPNLRAAFLFLMKNR